MPQKPTRRRWNKSATFKTLEKWRVAVGKKTIDPDELEMAFQLMARWMSERPIPALKITTKNSGRRPPCSP